MAKMSGWHHLTMSTDSHEGLPFEVPNADGPAARVEVLHEPDVPQGARTLAGGAVHPVALNTGNEENQMSLRAHIEGLGFTVISERKDRMNFKSCEVRSPGGALVELACTVPGGWALDEPADAIGSTLVFAPWFADRKDEMIAGLEPANF